MKFWSFKELIEKLKSWIVKIEYKLDCKIKRFWADNTKEFKKLAEWLKKKEIIMKFSTFYTSEQVDIVKWMNCTLLTIMRALLFDSELSWSFWSYAADAAVYIRNWTMKIRRTDKMFYELWTDKKLNLSNMRIWDCKCWIHLSNEKDKLNSRVKEDIFISYTDMFDQYLVFLPEKHQIMRAMNPKFVKDEKNKNFNSCRMQKSSQLERVKQTDFDDEVDENNSSNEDEIENEISSDSSILSSSTNSSNSSNTMNSTASVSSVSQIKKHTKFIERPVEIMKEKHNRKFSAIDEVSQEFWETQDLNITEQKIRFWWNSTISKEMINKKFIKTANLTCKFNKKSILKSNETAQLIYKIALTIKEQTEQDQILLFRTLKEAIKHLIYRLKWKKAVENEIISLISFSTWKLVKKTFRMSVISCKWVFLIKYETDGCSEQFKAWLVARGFTQ